MQLRTRVLIAGALILIAGTLYWQIRSAPDYPEAATIAGGVSDYRDLADRFATLAKAKGGVYAFEVLLRAVLPPGTDTHLLAHAVGNVLYEQRGIAGMADCTQDFRNACSHAIVINALYEFGEDILPQVHAACSKAPGGVGAYTMCFHGFGHGVFAYFHNDLSKTISYCKRAGTPKYRDQEYIECVGGAIMELIGDGGYVENDTARARQKYFTGPLQPCMSAIVPDDVKGICLQYLTSHIWESVGIDRAVPDPALFGKAFERCDVIPVSKPQLRKACFGSFGKEFDGLAAARDIRDLASLSDSALTEIASWCEASKPDDGKEYCIDSAVGSLFWGGENDPDLSFRFCRIIENALMQDACYRGLAEQIGIYIAPERRTPLCTKVPASFQSLCSPEDHS